MKKLFHFIPLLMLMLLCLMGCTIPTQSVAAVSDDNHQVLQEAVPDCVYQASVPCEQEAYTIESTAYIEKLAPELYTATRIMPNQGATKKAQPTGCPAWCRELPPPKPFLHLCLCT